MFEFFDGVANFFSTIWSWFEELFKFFGVVNDAFSSCYAVLSDIGLSALIGLIGAFLSVLLITKILGKS